MRGREAPYGDGRPFGYRNTEGDVGYLVSAVRWLDRNIEKTIILIAYSSMALIIVMAVVQRFFFSYQSPWSSTITIYLFLWVTWMGASYNTKIRAHLSFSELRDHMPYKLQFACLVLDAVLWIVFGSLVTYYTCQQVAIVHNNFAIVQGTDDVMQWWFYLATPLAWTLLIFRALQNLYADWQRYRRGEPFKHQVTLGD